MSFLCQWDSGETKGDLQRLVYWYGQDHDEDAPQLSLVDANDIKLLNNDKGLDTPLIYGDDPDKEAAIEALQDMYLDPKNRISRVRKIEEEKKRQLSTIPTRNRVLSTKLVLEGLVNDSFLLFSSLLLK